MKRTTLALVAALWAACGARADTFKDAGGAVAPPIVDVSRTGNAHVQCVLTVTTTATSLASLWTAAGCATALPAAPQFAWIGGYDDGGPFYYATGGAVPVAALTPGSSTFGVAQGVPWPIEGRLSVNTLQLIAPVSTVIRVEVRY